MCLRVLLTLLCVAALGTCNQVEDGHLPHCAPETLDQISSARKLLFVSTLDGRVTALDSKDGTEKWQVQAGDSLLSSSIHRLELNNGGQWVRLVPSLSGSLYRFSGESLEPLPLSAEQLLSASHKYSDDLVIAGGKETSSLGVSSKTGKVVYECSLNGCVNSTGWSENNADQIEEDPGEMVLIRRVTQTVRAIEPRTGEERWNFSVGQHELNLTPITTCILPTPTADLDESNLMYRVVVPEGLVCAVQKSAPNIVVWKKRLSSPIVGAWKNEGFELKALDLLGIAYAPSWEQEFPDAHPYSSHMTPSVYIGMHDRQLYVQESVRMQALVQSQISSRAAIDHSSHKHSRSLAIPWKPVPATKQPNWDSSEAETALQLSEKEYSTTALSVLYASEYVNGNGYFLFSDEDMKSIEGPVCDKINTSLMDPRQSEELDIDEDENDSDGGYVWSDDEPYTVLVVSLWYWWKEVAVIALSTAVFLNFISHRFRRRFSPPPEVHRTFVVFEHKVSPSQSSSALVPYQEPTPSPFTSRYLTDFSPLQCLGRGGFGIVFEARNKIDDCSYAVKRITLPYKKDKREKVLREVRALAKLDHSHIVRYFNAWLEEPPSGWQDPFEKELKSRLEFTESYSKVGHSVSHVPEKAHISHSVKLNGSTHEHLDHWGKGIVFHRNNISKLHHKLEFNRQRSFSLNDSFGAVLVNNYDRDDSADFSENSFDRGNSLTSPVREESDDDSFIVFADSDKEEENHNTKGGESVISISDTDFQIKANEHSTANDTNINIGDTASVVIDESQICRKSKRGHRKNLSLDLQSANRAPPEPIKPMYLYIQMQLCRTESLRDWLRQNTCLDVRNAEVVSIFEQIVHAVEYVHLQGLIHRDLKPSNIFFSFDGRIKVGDFGLVTAMIDPLDADQPRSPLFGMPDIANDKHTQHVGTHLYMSPEQLRGEAHGYKVDIWSLGLVLAELLIPFNTEMERVLALKDIREHRFPKGFTKQHPQEYSLLMLMLSQDPVQRPSTLGVRARAPLLHSTDPRYHFRLPPPITRSSSASSSLSRSTSGSSS